MNSGELSVQELNKSLEDMLRLIKTASAGSSVSIYREINEILYSAIRDYPSQVNAVNVEVLIDSSDSFQELPNFGYRGKLADYMEKALMQGFPTGRNASFNVHLPYEFKSKEESGGNDAKSASFRNIEFMPLNADYRIPATLRINFGNDQLLSEGFYFLPGEVSAIRLSRAKDSSFSPVDKGIKKGLENSTSSLAHYLYFKGFTKVVIDQDEMPRISNQLIDELAGSGVDFNDFENDFHYLIRNILVPDKSTQGLFVRRDNPLEIVSAYAALPTKKGFVLFNFQNVRLPEDLRRVYFLGEIAVPLAYLMALDRKMHHPNIFQSTGASVINNLHKSGSIRSF